jgi:hypothetical protein
VETKTATQSKSLRLDSLAQKSKFGILEKDSARAAVKCLIDLAIFNRFAPLTL